MSRVFGVEGSAFRAARSLSECVTVLPPCFCIQTILGILDHDYDRP